VHPAEKYDGKVPRYTSYPTAPHFTAAVDGDTYRRWLGELPPAEPLSLYFHIPFCDSMCWFCGCYTKIVRQYQPIADYLGVLGAEIDLVASALPARCRARHLHWGGGSPTMLHPDDWRALIDRLRQRFDIAADADLAVEIDPRDATEDYIAAIAEAGVNRASIGVQDFDPTVQTAVNRIQPFPVVARVCGWLRQHGIDHINLDLMYGLPYQDVARVVAMVDQAVSLAPSRIALFGYAHVPWMKSHQKLIDEALLPDAQARWQQATAAAEHLRQAGYRAIGLDHFARPDDPLAVADANGRLRRNFQGYTTDDASLLLGFGASAIGSLPQGYVQNATPINQYRQTIGAGRPATARGIRLSADDRLRGAIIERLMCRLTVDIDDLCADVDGRPDDFDDALHALAPMAGDGLVVIDHRRIRVTEAGRPFVRVVAAAFDRYLRQGEVRHSRAV
jgi:oxygen-independent coproporphyrinogen-3 oxidase